MQPRTRTWRGIAFVALAAALGGGLAWAVKRHAGEGPSPRALDAVPAGALLVATADVKALRASPLGASVLKDGREIQGVGKIKDVCGFDPMDTIEEVAIAVPAAGDGGDFGLAAAGSIDAEALLDCASKVIQARGGRPVVTPIGSFSTVRDAGAEIGGGEIAVRRGGPVLLGGGAYLRAMIDSADGRSPGIRASVAHGRLAEQVGGAAARVTVVLTPELRAQLANELSLSGSPASPASTILAGGLGVDLGPDVALHAVIACAAAPGCAELGARLAAARDARVEDHATQLVGFAAVLARVELQPEGDALHIRVAVPAAEAGALLDRLIALRGLSHPQVDVRGSGSPDGALRAEPPPEPKPLPPLHDVAQPGSAAPAPDGVVAPPRGSAERAPTRN
ncbi:MAG: hypothetical protein IT372_11775 [Polyangiaceae bacterium]|nr:hypothetical protein [Polyangiaceae bacterium]